MSEDLMRYLTFSIQTETYGIAIEKIREIIRHEKITVLRDSANYLKGVINLRGSIIPIIDMKVKFGLEFQEYNDRTVFIIVELVDSSSTQLIGLAVDNVFEVVNVKEDSIQAPPKIGLNKKGEYLHGIIRLKNDMAMLLNIDKILSTEEILTISQDLNLKI